MEFKWEQHAPFTSYSTLATRMGISTKMVRRYAKNLEQKGCLKRLIRTGRTNRFDQAPQDSDLAGVGDGGRDG